MYKNLSIYYNDLFPHQKNMMTKLEPYSKKGGQAIDLGCGTGRLTHDIFQLKMNVLGIDLDSDMIEVAKTSYPEILYKVCDMLEAFDLDVTYDLITCFGNTLVHLDRNELIDLFNKIEQKMNKGAYFIVQTLNYKRIHKEKPAQLKAIQHHHLELFRMYDYEQDHIIFTTKIIDDQKEMIGSTKLYPHQEKDYQTITKSLDLELKVYGDLDQTSLLEDSYYAYYVFQKKS